MHRGYYAIIPATVRYDENLSANAKLLYGEITALCNQKGFCWAGNGYFADLYNKDKSTIARWIRQLEEQGYIRRQVTYKSGTQEVEARYMQICEGGTGKNAPTPTGKNARVNTTELNTTEEEKVNAHSFYMNNIGVLSPFIADNITEWSNDLTEDVVTEAIKTAVNANVLKWKYVEGVLRDWNKKGINSMEKLEAMRNRDKQKEQPKRKQYEEPKEESNAEVNDEIGQAFM